MPVTLPGPVGLDISRADRIFGRLLRLFPAGFRGDFGDDTAATFTGSAALVAALAVAASLVPAWRATRVDPLIALRTE